MRETVDSTYQLASSILWLLQEVWRLGTLLVARIAATWPEGHLPKEIGFIVLAATLTYIAFIISRRVLKGMHYVYNLLACIVVLLMGIVPTVAITFLALAGAFWVAKSF